MVEEQEEREGAGRHWKGLRVKTRVYADIAAK